MSFIFWNITKRFCHHHSRHVPRSSKKLNPLVECEKIYAAAKASVKSQDVTSVNITSRMSVYVGNKLVHIQHNISPVSIHYFDEKNKLCKINVDI